MSNTDKMILALDMQEPANALEIVDKFSDYINIFKVGFELFVSAGPRIVEEILKKDKKVFLDLKFHDIPNTVSKAAVAATKLGVNMFNLHTSGGLDMMKKCRENVVETCLKESLERPRILGVTVLTSISREILKEELGIQYSLKTHVKQLAFLAMNAGLDGVISSPRDAGMIRKLCDRDFLIVTPGIRPSWTLPDDQKRTMTPREALKQGADHIVLGRAVLQQPDPIKAIELILLEVLSA
jgi:orotidine-5'-phosphate decarboxylase